MPGSESALSGPPSAWIDTLSRWSVDLGIDSFVLWPSGDDVPGRIELFGSEAVPGVRAVVG